MQINVNQLNKKVKITNTITIFKLPIDLKYVTNISTLTKIISFIITIINCFFNIQLKIFEFNSFLFVANC